MASIARPRILCLHGHSQTSSRFRAKIGALRKKLKEFDFVELDAPYRIPVPAEHDAGSIWWDRMPLEGSEESASTGAPGRFRAMGWAITLHYITSAIASHGPFIGILAFSQGAAAALLLLMSFKTHGKPPPLGHDAIPSCAYAADRWYEHKGIGPGEDQVSPSPTDAAPTSPCAASLLPSPPVGVPAAVLDVDAARGHLDTIRFVVLISGFVCRDVDAAAACGAVPHAGFIEKANDPAVLWVIGEADEVISPAFTREAIRVLPGLELVHGGGHVVPLGREPRDAICDFIRSSSGLSR